jgi:CheY-like chemotaxis protein
VSKRPTQLRAPELATKLARDLEEWALVREKVLTRLDVRSARKARSLASALRNAMTGPPASLETLIREGQSLLLLVAAPDDDAPRERPTPTDAERPRKEDAAYGSGVNVRRDTVPQPSAPRLNVLVVDDDPVVRTLMVRRLAAIAQVDSVGSIEDARALLARDTYDVVVSDLDLNGQSGAALLAEVAKSHPLTRRILFTGTPEALQESLRTVCHELLEKSSGVSQLIEAVSPPLFTDDSPTPDYTKRDVVSGEHATGDEVDLPATKPHRSR